MTLIFCRLKGVPVSHSEGMNIYAYNMCWHRNVVSRSYQIYERAEVCVVRRKWMIQFVERRNVLFIFPACLVESNAV